MLFFNNWHILRLLNVSIKVHTGFGKFWKFIEIDNEIENEIENEIDNEIENEIENEIVHDLGIFGKGELFQNGYGKVLDFCSGKF